MHTRSQRGQAVSPYPGGITRGRVSLPDPGLAASSAIVVPPPRSRVGAFHENEDNKRRMGYRLIRTPPYCHWKKGRRPGVGYWYHCRKVYPLARLRFSPEFMTAYDAVHNGKLTTIGKPPGRRTMAVLISLTSPRFNGRRRRPMRSGEAQS
jgi:hypothetical protein